MNGQPEPQPPKLLAVLIVAGVEGLGWLVAVTALTMLTEVWV